MELHLKIRLDSTVNNLFKTINMEILFVYRKVVFSTCPAESQHLSYHNVGYHAPAGAPHIAEGAASSPCSSCLIGFP